jgi:hypothetical protein
MKLMDIATQNGTQNGTQAELGKPEKPGAWELEQIIKALSRKLPEQLLSQREQGGKNLDYIPWHTVVQILNKYAPGWGWEIRTMQLSSDRLFLVGRLTIPAQDGLHWREATGTEELKEEYFDKIEKVKKIREIAYGDPSSNAESMAFRRSAAKFGLGLYLYNK